MVVDFHHGYTHTLACGSELHVESTDPGVIAMTTRYPGGRVDMVTLSTDEALQVALSLLREQSLERFGHG